MIWQLGDGLNEVWELLLLINEKWNKKHLLIQQVKARHHKKPVKISAVIWYGSQWWNQMFQNKSSVKFGQKYIEKCKIRRSWEAPRQLGIGGPRSRKEGRSREGTLTFTLEKLKH